MIFTSFILFGCTSVQIREDRNITTGMEIDEALTVALDFRGGTKEDAHALEDKIYNCIIKAFRKANSQVRIISPDEFRNSFFPGMDIDSMPRTQESINLLLGNPAVREKISKLRLRYLIVVRVDTSTAPDPDITKDGLYLYGFLVGWHESTSMTAKVIGLKSPCVSGKVEATAKGESVYGTALLLIPVIKPAHTQSSACKKLGEALSRFILGNNTP